MVEKTGIRNEVAIFDHPTACVQASMITVNCPQNSYNPRNVIDI